MYRPLLTEVPDTPERWWLVLRDLVRTWYAVDLQERPAGDTEQRRLVAASGLVLSSVFDEWKAFHGDLAAAGIFGRAMRDSYALDWHPELNSITLLIQGEHDLYWSVDAEYVGEADPPVGTWILDYDAGETWRPYKPWRPTTTAFVLNHLLSYLKGSAGGLNTNVASVDVADSLLLPLVDNRVELNGQVIYEGTDLLAFAGASPWTEDHATNLSIEMGDTWVGRIPQQITDFSDAAGGMRHGELVPPELRSTFDLGPGFDLRTY